MGEFKYKKDQTVILSRDMNSLYFIHFYESCQCYFVFACSSRAHSPMIAVGSDDSNTAYSGKVQIYEYVENTRCVLQFLFFGL